MSVPVDEMNQHSLVFSDLTCSCQLLSEDCGASSLHETIVVTIHGDPLICYLIIYIYSLEVDKQIFFLDFKQQL